MGELIRTPKVGCLLLVVLLWLGALSVRAEYFYVATNGAGGDYKSWATAATNIQDAVNGATNTGDIVLVSNGVYTTTTPVVYTNSGIASFTNRSIVCLTNKITLKSVNGPATTVIDGNYPAITARVVFVSQQATLDGFTIRNGRAAAFSASYLNGGGVFIFYRGTSAGEQYYGGTVTNCIVHGNYAEYGGGITIYQATGVVANCTIYSNTAGTFGGGIAVEWATTASWASMINNCVIWGNKATSGNSTYGGGGLYSYASGVTVKNCLIYGNNSYGRGGGVLVSYTAYRLALENCAITANTASNMGGGFYMTNGATLARNSIIYNNYATTNYADAYTWDRNVLTNCAIGDTNGVPNWNTSGNITNNPQFINTANNNYRLLASSPCINAGTNQSWMTGGVDLDGKPRIRYQWVDIGAYEHINRGTIYGFQ